MAGDAIKPSHPGYAVGLAMTNCLLGAVGPRWLLFAACCLAATDNPATAAEPPPARVAAFQADITPPLGSPLCGGWIKPLAAVDDPLLGKGIVIEQAERRFVLCALDWCEVRNEAHTHMRQALADAANCPLQHVAVQCLHQHDAPLVDTAAQALLDASPQSLPLMSLAGFADAVHSLEQAVRQAVASLRPCDELATGLARVERVAATRRVRTPEGKILVRYSSTTDPALHAAPEGDIDPLLRTISFVSQGKPLVRLHYYATHPQSYYGDGRATSDIPGLARRQLEAEEQIPQIYFTGCAGDVTAGKYNDGSPSARRELTGRLAAGMRTAIAAARPQPIGPIHMRTAELVFPLRDDGGYSQADGERELAAVGSQAQVRLKGALTLAFRRRSETPIEISALCLGAVRILHLPGEPFVTFQQQAQRLRPDLFVAVAGYGDGGPGYLCTADSFAEGGYEPTASLVSPRSEQVLRDGVARLLSDNPASSSAVAP